MFCFVQGVLVVTTACIVTKSVYYNSKQPSAVLKALAFTFFLYLLTLAWTHNQALIYNITH